MWRGRHVPRSPRNGENNSFAKTTGASGVSSPFQFFPGTLSLGLWQEQMVRLFSLNCIVCIHYQAGLILKCVFVFHLLHCASLPWAKMLFLSAYYFWKERDTCILKATFLVNLSHWHAFEALVLKGCGISDLDKHFSLPTAIQGLCTQVCFY